MAGNEKKKAGTQPIIPNSNNMFGILNTVATNDNPQSDLEIPTSESVDDGTSGMSYNNIEDRATELTTIEGGVQGIQSRKSREELEIRLAEDQRTETLDHFAIQTTGTPTQTSMKVSDTNLHTVEASTRRIQGMLPPQPQEEVDTSHKVVEGEAKIPRSIQEQDGSEKERKGKESGVATPTTISTHSQSTKKQTPSTHRVKSTGMSVATQRELMAQYIAKQTRKYESRSIGVGTRTKFETHKGTNTDLDANEAFALNKILHDDATIARSETESEGEQLAALKSKYQKDVQLVRSELGTAGEEAEKVAEKEREPQIESLRGDFKKAKQNSARLEKEIRETSDRQEQNIKETLELLEKYEVQNASLLVTNKENVDQICHLQQNKSDLEKKVENLEMVNVLLKKEVAEFERLKAINTSISASPSTEAIGSYDLLKRIAELENTEILLRSNLRVVEKDLATLTEERSVLESKNNELQGLFAGQALLQQQNRELYDEVKSLREAIGDLRQQLDSRPAFYGQHQTRGRGNGGGSWRGRGSGAESSGL